MHIHIDSNKIKSANKQTLLGVYIDESLPKISLLRQLSSYISVEAKKLYYQGNILPLIDCGSKIIKLGRWLEYTFGDIMEKS